MYESYRTAKGDSAIRVFLNFKEAVEWLDSGSASPTAEAVAETEPPS
jgi:hypothetical protein